MSHQPCAIVGVGQTHHKKPPLATSRSAAWSARRRPRALDDAEMTWADIDAVVIGKAPDLFEGVMKPELYLADALGARGQADVPRAHRGLGRRHHGHRRARTSSRPARHERVLAVACEKQSRGQRAVRASAAGKGASHRRRRRVRAVHPRVHRAHAARPTYIGWMVAVKDRLNALKNPYAHLQARRHLASRR